MIKDVYIIMSKIVLDNGYRKLIDENIKDAFNHKIYVAVEDDNKFIGLRYIISKREQEQRRKEHYGNYQKMHMSTTGECIDITKDTYNKIIKLGYIIPEYYISEKWNPMY